MDTPGCVSPGSSHLQEAPLSAIRKWKLRSFDFKDAFLRAGGFERDVFLHAPEERDPPSGKRLWKLKAPARGLNDAPAAFHRSLKRNLSNSELFVEKVGLRRQASTSDPCLFFVFRAQGQSVGALATHIDGILICGEPDVLPKLREFLEQRLGGMELQENSFAHAGMKLAQDASSFVTMTQGGLAKNLQPLGASPQLWAARQKSLPPEDVMLRQCKLGGLC